MWRGKAAGRGLQVLMAQVRKLRVSNFMVVDVVDVVVELSGVLCSRAWLVLMEWMNCCWFQGLGVRGVLQW